MKQIFDYPYDPYTRQGELFDVSEQFDMTKPQAEAYHAWREALRMAYGDRVQLHPSNKHQGRGESFPFVTFDLKWDRISSWAWITIDADGRVQLPISYYRLNYEEKPDWMHRAQGMTLRPITRNDVAEIIKGFEETI